MTQHPNDPVERMSEDEAAMVGAYAKELFRYVTDAQANAVIDVMMRLPRGLDPNGRTPVRLGEHLLRVVAARSGPENRLSIPDVAKEVDAELSRRGIPSPSKMSTATRLYAANRAGWSDIERRRAVEEEWALGLSDEDAAELTIYALCQIPDPATRGVWERRKATVRTSVLLRAKAYEWHLAEALR